jgi:hypothetical protein
MSPDGKLREAARRDPASADRALREAAKRAVILHDGGQSLVGADDTRFQILTAGRRWGKTKLAARKLIRAARANPGSLNWWVANYYRNTRRGYQEVVRQMPPAMLAKPAPPPTSNDLRLELKNGSTMEFYSGGNPDALAGAGVDYMVVDEAALIPENVWFQLLRPTLMDSEGGAFIISTPRGRNWFWKLWQMGQQNREGYKSWSFTSYDNPYIPNSELDETKASLPEIVFRSEIMAEFVADAASIFRFEDDAVMQTVFEPRGQLYMGIDLAKKEDFTVLSASRADDRMPVFHQRMNELSWPTQIAEIKAAIKYLEDQPAVDAVSLAVDSTGVGDVVFDDLDEAGFDVTPVTFTNAWKQQAVNLLAADLARNQAYILEDQREEFETYEYTISDAGRWKFEAAVGHDDEVSAKLLEHWLTVNEGAPDVNVIAGDAREEPTDAVVEEITPDVPEAIGERADAWSGGRDLWGAPAGNGRGTF